MSVKGRMMCPVCEENTAAATASTAIAANPGFTSCSIKACRGSLPVALKALR